MTVKSKEFASTRLPIGMKAKIERMARNEKRSLSQMLKLLVEEAVNQREYADRMHRVNESAMETVLGQQ